MVRTSLAIPQPFDARWMLDFLRARQAPAIERIDEQSITRAIRVAGRPALLRMRLGAARITAECSADIPPAALRAIVMRMLDLDANLEAFAQHVARDRFLAGLLRARPGLRVPQFLDPFECVVRAVLGQQVSVRAASTLVNRLAVAVGDVGAGADVAVSAKVGSLRDPTVCRSVTRRRKAGPCERTIGPYRLMPAPEQLAEAGPDRLQRIGLTGARAASLHAIATAVAEHRVDLEALRTAPGEEAQATLDALPGVGPWTASYIRMRGLGDRDAFPAADLGVLKALRLTAAQAERRSERWRPWRAYAAIYLWSAGPDLGGPQD